MRTTVVVAAAAALLSGAGALAAAPALAAPSSPPPPTCGETITASVTLAANLNCSSDSTTPALTIGADDVTVNLNGYTIEGPGDTASNYVYPGISDGVGNGDGYSGLVVTGGTISDYWSAVEAEGVANGEADLTGVQVTKMHFVADSPEIEIPVQLAFVQGALVTDNTSLDADQGVYIDQSTDCTVSDNTAEHADTGVEDRLGTGDILSGNKSTYTAGVGIYTDDGSGLTVKGNSTSGANAFGIEEFGTSDSSFKDNTFNHVAEGIVNDIGSGNTWTQNNTSHDGVGIADYQSTDTYTGSVTYADQYGIALEDPSGVTVTDSHSNYDSEAGLQAFTSDGQYTDATVTNDVASHDRYGFYADDPITVSSGNTAAADSVLACFNIECNGDVPRAEQPGVRVAAPPRPAAPAVRGWYAKR